MTEKNIKDRAYQSLHSRMDDLCLLYMADPYDSENWSAEVWETAKDFDIYLNMDKCQIEDVLYTKRFEYPLCFDYVQADDDFDESYYRYQISWGGPAEEIRYYVNNDSHIEPYKIEFWFLDWFEGHGIELTNEYREIAIAIFEDMKELGAVGAAYDIERNL